MNNSDALAERQNKQEYAYNTLKEMIITNQLPADTNLIERQLCELLNLSRTPVRAALQDLENDSLAVYYPGRGMVVSKIQIEDFVEIFELRSALDILALRLFMQSDHGEIVRLMRKTVDDMARFLEEGDFRSFVRCDSAFHEYYFYNTGNKRLSKIMSTVADQIKRILNLTATDKERCRMSYEDHVRIIDAIESGDLQKASDLLLCHISGSLEYHIKKATRR